jgi:hypothetical protein
MISQQMGLCALAASVNTLKHDKHAKVNPRIVFFQKTWQLFTDIYIYDTMFHKPQNI